MALALDMQRGDWPIVYIDWALALDMQRGDWPTILVVLVLVPSVCGAARLTARADYYA